jgi:hypothetical protein
MERPQVEAAGWGIAVKRATLTVVVCMWLHLVALPCNSDLVLMDKGSPTLSPQTPRDHLSM